MLDVEVVQIDKLRMVSTRQHLRALSIVQSEVTADRYRKRRTAHKIFDSTKSGTIITSSRTISRACPSTQSINQVAPAPSLKIGRERAIRIIATTIPITIRIVG